MSLNVFKEGGQVHNVIYDQDGIVGPRGLRIPSTYIIGGSTGVNDLAINTNPTQTAAAYDQYGVALGHNASSSGVDSFALGVGATTTFLNAVAIGTAAKGYADSTIAIGNGAEANTANGVAIGSGAMSLGGDNVTIGNGATTTSANSVIMGTGAANTGSQAVVIGASASSNSPDSVAIGHGANCTSQYTVALGYQASATHSDNVCIGKLAKSLGGAVNVVVGASCVANGSGGVVIGSGAQTDNHTGDIAIGSGAATNNDFAIAIGQTAHAYEVATVAIGLQALTDKSNGIAIGSLYATNNAPYAGGVSSVAIGGASPSEYGAQVTGDYGVAIGVGTNTPGNSVAVGHQAASTGVNSVALGYGATANDTECVAIGHGSSATSRNSTCIGPQAGATQIGGITISNGPISNTSANTYLVGSNTNGTVFHYQKSNVAGHTIFRNPPTGPTLTPTAGQIFAGCIIAGAGGDLTIPTAAGFIAVMPDARVGDTFQFVVSNPNGSNCNVVGADATIKMVAQGLVNSTFIPQFASRIFWAQIIQLTPSVSIFVY